MSISVEKQLYRFHTLTPPRTAVGFRAPQIPERIAYVQRRAHFRVTPPDEDSAFAPVRYQSEEDFRVVRLRDLGIGGMLVDDRAVTSGIEVGDPVVLQVVGDGGKRFELAASVVRFGENRGIKHGAEVAFVSQRMTPSEERVLGDILMEWQREHLRAGKVRKDID